MLLLETPVLEGASRGGVNKAGRGRRSGFAGSKTSSATYTLDGYLVPRA
jgi:hypothetical protein